MKFYIRAIGLVVGVAMLAGCASTNVTRQTPMTARGLARPNQIWVYDFVAASSDMPAVSSLAGPVGVASTPPTPQGVGTGPEECAIIAPRFGQKIYANGPYPDGARSRAPPPV